MNSAHLPTPLADVLIVDDEPNNLRLLSTLLNNQGYKTRSALSGEVALKAAHSTPPDLILLDIAMPGMDGYQVCDRLRKDSSTCNIPVMFISAKDRAFDKVKAFAVGGVDYISKPFQVEEVFARIEYHLKLYRLQLKIEEQNIQLQTEICQRIEIEKIMVDQNLQLQQEIEHRSKIEVELQQANAQLALTNKELEQFAAVASHDLRSPLTSISAYAQLLEFRNLKRLDPESIDYLEKILKLCDRMNLLIGDLLSYAQLNQTQEPFNPIPCKAIVAQACENLATEISQNQAEIIYGDLPAIKGAESQLVQLFQNLIGNAIKYRREESPKIHINAQLKEDCYLFTVKDNGLGIADKDREEIFQVFKRLHGQGKYSGTGIGLAICRKIIERHGGSIWIESQLGEGSTFYFTLPANPSAM